MDLTNFLRIAQTILTIIQFILDKLPDVVSEAN